MEKSGWSTIHQDTYQQECGCAAIQRDCGSLESPAIKNLMEFNKGKYEVLHMIGNNPMHQSKLRLTCWKAALHRKTWWSWGTKNGTWASNVSLWQRLFWSLLRGKLGGKRNRSKEVIPPSTYSLWGWITTQSSCGSTTGPKSGFFGTRTCSPESGPVKGQGNN